MKAVICASAALLSLVARARIEYESGRKPDLGGIFRLKLAADNAVLMQRSAELAAASVETKTINSTDGVKATVALGVSTVVLNTPAPA